MRKGVDLRQRPAGESFPPAGRRTQLFKLLAVAGLAVLALGLSFVVFLNVDLAAGLGTLVATWGLSRLLALGGRRHGPLSVGIPMVTGVALVALGFAILPAHRPQVAPKPAVSAAPTASATVAATPSVTPSPTLDQLREQARQAYLRYWDVVKETALSHDPGPLSQVAAGTALTYAQSALEHDRSLGQTYIIQMEHNIKSTVVVDGLGGLGIGAQVDDFYVDHTVRVDPATLRPLEPDPNRHGHQSFTLKEVSPGSWKVVLGSEIN